jgi:hypothetical protein
MLNRLFVPLGLIACLLILFDCETKSGPAQKVVEVPARAQSLEDSTGLDKLSNFEKSLNQQFGSQFPGDILLDQKEKETKPQLSEKEADFYDKYVGIYFQQDDLDPKYFDRNVYSIESSKNDWGVAYYYAKWANRIDYDSENKKFYLAEGGGADEIKDISSFTLPDKWIRVGNPGEPGKFFVSSIERKKKESEGRVLSKLTEDEIGRIKDTVSSLYKAVVSSNVDKFVELFSSQEPIHRGSVDQKELDRSKLEDLCMYLKTELADNDGNNNFDLYLNVFFSEDYNMLKSIYPNLVLLELRDRDDRASYVSLGFVPEGDNYKIVYIRDDFDME